MYSSDKNMDKSNRVTSHILYLNATLSFGLDNP